MLLEGFTRNLGELGYSRNGEPSSTREGRERNDILAVGLTHSRGVAEVTFSEAGAITT